MVGGSVLRVLAAPDWEEALALSAEGEGAVLSLPVTAGAGPPPRAFDLSVHRRDGPLVLEFEPGEADPAASRDFYQGVRRALGRLRSATSVAERCATAVREMRALTGFERVVAESVADGWEPWLGLWFPATSMACRRSCSWDSRMRWLLTVSTSAIWRNRSPVRATQGAPGSRTAPAHRAARSPTPSSKTRRTTAAPASRSAFPPGQGSSVSGSSGRISDSGEPSSSRGGAQGPSVRSQPGRVVASVSSRPRWRT